MGSSTLRLKEIMNRPESLDMSREWLALDRTTSPAILVCGEQLAQRVLKSDKVSPYNLMEFWKKVSKVPASDLPRMEEYFKSIPLFLDENAHRLARKQLVTTYRRVEQSIDQWLPLFTHQFLSGFSDEEALYPVRFLNRYLNQVFKEIIARDISCPADELPSLSIDTFSLLPRAEKLRKFESELANLVETIEKLLATYAGSTEDAWALTSIAVMGREPMLGALMFGLMHSPPDNTKWTGESLAHASAPVNILTRQMQEDAAFDDLNLVKGQLIQVCPFIAHQQSAKKSDSAESAASSTTGRSLSFGAGLHFCQGRSISLKIMDAFFNALYVNERIHFDTTGLKLVRDFLLQTKEHA